MSDKNMVLETLKSGDYYMIELEMQFKSDFRKDVLKMIDSDKELRQQIETKINIQKIKELR